MRIGLYPGSFDPITLGHKDIITRALSLVDKLVVGVGVSATKKPLFNVEERIAMIEEELASAAKKAGVELSVLSFDGLLVDVAQKHKASLIVRGLRSGTDFEYEAQMTAMNRKMNKDIETVFLASTPEVGFISSTLVRQISAMGGDVSPFVSPYVKKLMEKK
ncbi:MAG: pantetheine-phosphate adenylyltransferase [Alphaproteobacteria bacterium]|nr:pantetheine-phosphate adenylyltransferase [Alphaproteobacteria bacterium]MBE8220689.1 pantetheine-phosphate adenylyltransferase [Alphaproteobacteria bacterium]